MMMRNKEARDCRIKSDNDRCFEFDNDRGLEFDNDEGLFIIIILRIFELE